VTFHRYPSFAIQTALEMMKKLHSGSFFKSKYVEQIESMDILHVILDSISDTDRPIVDSLDAELYHLQDFIYESTMSDDFDLMRVSDSFIHNWHELKFL
jgi:Mg2+ and Co2+ transporter CorA